MRDQFPFPLPHSRGCCRKVEPLASDSPWNILFLRECFSFSSIRTGITLSKLLAVSEMCTQGLVGWITFFWPPATHLGPQALKSSVLSDSYYLGLRTPLDMRMPISSVPFSDCPIENGLSTISCATLMTMINISYLRNEAMIWWCLKPWLSKFCCDGDKR